MLCDVTRWGHLPQAGGWYDQNPDIVDRFWYILSERAKEEEKQRKAEESKRGGPGGKRVAGRRR